MSPSCCVQARFALASLLGDRLVQVQNQVGHGGVGGQLARVRAAGRAAIRRRASSFSAAAGCARNAANCRSKLPRSTDRSRSAGTRASARRKAQCDPLVGRRARRLSSPARPGRGRPRRTSRRSAAPAPAAACWCATARTVQASRPAASKVIIDGGAIVRFQNVYRLRRYRSAPWSCTKSPPPVSSFHKPGGW